MLDLARLLVRAQEKGLAGPLGELGFYFKDPVGDGPSSLGEQYTELRRFAARLRDDAGTARPGDDPPASPHRTAPPAPVAPDTTSGAGTPAPGTTPPAAPRPGRAAAWAELVRLPALFTVPGDTLAGVAAAGRTPGARALLPVGSSLCLYAAGMVLNDWADRAEDAVERPHRPLPSGRVRPAAAFAAACGLTGAGLLFAARAGRPALAVAVPLAATVWAYDLALKHTPAGPAAMAAARALDLLMGAAAAGDTKAAAPSAALLGCHTLAVTAVSRRETTGARRRPRSRPSRRRPS